MSLFPELKDCEFKTEFGDYGWLLKIALIVVAEVRLGYAEDIRVTMSWRLRKVNTLPSEVIMDELKWQMWTNAKERIMYLRGRNQPNDD